MPQSMINRTVNIAWDNDYLTVKRRPTLRLKLNMKSKMIMKDRMMKNLIKMTLPTKKNPQNNGIWYLLRISMSLIIQSGQKKLMRPVG